MSDVAARADDRVVANLRPRFNDSIRLNGNSFAQLCLRVNNGTRVDSWGKLHRGRRKPAHDLLKSFGRIFHPNYRG